MNEKKSNNADVQMQIVTDNKGGRFGLWVGLGAAALTALGVVGLAIYTDYQQTSRSATASGVAQAYEQAPSSIPVTETQAASIAAHTSDVQVKGMVAPSDVGEDAAPIVMASQVVMTTTTPVPALVASSVVASDTAQAILAADGAAQEQSKVVVEDNGIVRFYFATGKADVTANTLEALKGIVEGVQAGKKAMILTYSNVESNERLARDRALAVRSVLLAAGIPDGSIQVSNPKAEANDSRRVEVVLR